MPFHGDFNEPVTVQVEPIKDVDGGWLVTIAGGLIDVVRSATIREEVDSCFQDGAAWLVLDYTNLRAMNATGVGKAAQIAKDAADSGGGAVIVAPVERERPSVGSYLRMCLPSVNPPDWFRFAEDRDEGMGLLRQMAGSNHQDRNHTGGRE